MKAVFKVDVTGATIVLRAAVPVFLWGVGGGGGGEGMCDDFRQVLVARWNAIIV